MVSSKAEARRKKFIKLKQNYEDINDLIKEQLERDLIVVFNSDGNILSVSPNDMGHDFSDKDLSKAIFTKEQVKILEGKNLSDYMVKTDPIHATKHTITVRPTEKQFVKTSDFLEKIELSKSRSYDVSVKLKDNTFTVKLSNKTKKQFKDIDTKIASIKSIRQFAFYITAENDPHYMLHTERVTLKDLIENTSIERKIPLELAQCDVYTMKIFDKYVRT